jgi:hypothetical protein
VNYYEDNEVMIFIKMLVTGIYTLLASFLTKLGVEISDAFMALGVLLVIDVITGVIKSYKLDIKITSNNLKYGFLSKLILLLIPIIFQIGAKGVDIDGTNIVTISYNILIISELYSIIGNIYSIQTKESLPEMDAIQMIGRKLRNILLNLVGDRDYDDYYRDRGRNREDEYNNSSEDYYTPKDFEGKRYDDKDA